MTNEFKLVLNGNFVVLETEDKNLKEVFNDMYGGDHGLVVTDEPSNEKCVGLREANSDGNATGSILLLYTHYNGSSFTRDEAIECLVSDLKDLVEDNVLPCLTA
jgi:hypothetical protein